jgi:proteasome alpha subunit
MTPYDWQESIAQRTEFADARLEGGVPLVAVSLKSAVLCVTLSSGPRKIFEVYDRLMLGALGQQADLEAIRTAAIDFCHQEGFRRSEEDVTIQRLSSSLSASLKQAFGDLSTVPFAVKCLLTEVADSGDEDRFVVLDPQGDYRESKGIACAAPDEAMAQEILKEVEGFKLTGDTDSVAKKIAEVIRKVSNCGDKPNLQAAVTHRVSETDRAFELL